MRPRSVPNRSRTARRLTRRKLLALAASGALTVATGGAIARLVLSGRVRARPTPGAPPAATASPQTSSFDLSFGLSPERQVGQLFMVGLSGGSSAAALAQTKDAIASHHAGNVMLYDNGWSSAGTVRAVVQPLQQLARDANAGVGLFVSGNQEGGQQGSFQAFYGPGFDTIPRPIDQAQAVRGDPEQLWKLALTWGGQLLQAGVNLNLAPVLDTVPAEAVASNDPIGHWGREYGFDPATVEAYGVAFERGMRAAGVAVAIKHFPGLGRVTGNTDFTDQGIVDDALTGTSDPYLQPYAAAIREGAEFVMMSLASYPRIDSQPAVFSRVMMNAILRDSLGFQNIILTDDVGAAAAVADRPPEQRALDFLRAGGDMVLTVQPADVARMSAAVLQAAMADAAFGNQISRSAQRVLRIKRSHGLLPAARSS